CVSIAFPPIFLSRVAGSSASRNVLISNPLKKCLFGDTPNPCRGLAALCTPAPNDHSSNGFHIRPQFHPRARQEELTRGPKVPARRCRSPGAGADHPERFSPPLSPRPASPSIPGFPPRGRT